MASISFPALTCSFLPLDDDLFLNFREFDAGIEEPSCEDDKKFGNDRVGGNNDVFVAIISTTSEKTELDSCGAQSMSSPEAGRLEAGMREGCS